MLALCFIVLTGSIDLNTGSQAPAMHSTVHTGLGVDVLSQEDSVSALVAAAQSPAPTTKQGMCSQPQVSICNGLMLPCMLR